MKLKEEVPTNNTSQSPISTASDTFRKKIQRNTGTPKKKYSDFKSGALTRTEK